MTAKLKVSSDPRTVFSCAVDGQRALPGMEEAGEDAAEASDGAREGKRILRRLVESGKMTISMPKAAEEAIRKAAKSGKEDVAALKEAAKSLDTVRKVAGEVAK